MISDEQWKKLPELLKEIIEVDRNLDTLRESQTPIIQSIIRLRKRRAELRRAAAQVWGPLGGDKDQTTVRS